MSRTGSCDFGFNMVTLAAVLRLKCAWTRVEARESAGSYSKRWLLQEMMVTWIRLVTLELVRRTWSPDVI